MLKYKNHIFSLKMVKMSANSIVYFGGYINTMYILIHLNYSMKKMVSHKVAGGQGRDFSLNPLCASSYVHASVIQKSK